MHFGNPRHAYVRKNLRESQGSSEHLHADIQLSVQHREDFMMDIDQCEIFIATFIAPLDENRLKPNRNQRLLPFTTPIDFSALL